MSEVNQRDSRRDHYLCGHRIRRHGPQASRPAEDTGRIATAAVEVAKAGAAVAHIHVREPDTGAPSRRVELFTEAVERIRDSATDAIINLTTGIGGDLWLGPDDDPLNFSQETDCVGQMPRIVDVEATLPEICSLDCGSFNYLGGNYVYVGTQDMIETGARRMREIGVKPELEVFDTGRIWLAKQMIDQGLIDDPPLIQICLGIPWGAPATRNVFQAMVNELPPGCDWAGIAIGKMEFPLVTRVVSLGGDVRLGLGDNLYLEKGVVASNAELVERARAIVESMGARVLAPQQARETSGLEVQASRRVGLPQ